MATFFNIALEKKQLSRSAFEKGPTSARSLKKIDTQSEMLDIREIKQTGPLLSQRQQWCLAWKVTATAPIFQTQVPA